jgi:diadenosine tetraphosphate (Ap4A) HIT family hydrolase
MKGGRLARRPVPGSLGLLPSGPDPVGEWLVHHQPPEAHIGNIASKCKPTKQKTAITLKTPMEEHLQTFRPDDRIERDSEFVTVLGLCQLRLQNDCRWPWLVLVPQRPGMTELFELTPLDQAMLTFETNMVAKALKDITDATKINVGALGNIVRQLHVHIIARQEGDTCWPGPIWGHGTAVPYSTEEKQTFLKKLAGAL